MKGVSNFVRMDEGHVIDYRYFHIVDIFIRKMRERKIKTKKFFVVVPLTTTAVRTQGWDRRTKRWPRETVDAQSMGYYYFY